MQNQFILPNKSFKFKQKWQELLKKKPKKIRLNQVPQFQTQLPKKRWKEVLCLRILQWKVNKVWRVFSLVLATWISIFNRIYFLKKMECKQNLKLIKGRELNLQ